MDRREIGSAEIFRKIGVRASEGYLFGPIVILHVRFAGYADEPFNVKCNISFYQYEEYKDIGVISKNTSFAEYACNNVYEYLEDCTEFKGRVLYKDLYEVINNCLNPYNMEVKMKEVD